MRLSKVTAVSIALRLLLNGLRLLLAPLWLIRRAALRPRSRCVRVRLSETPVELPQAVPVWQRWLQARQSAGGLASIDQLWRLVRTIAADPAIDCLSIELPPLRAGWATCASLRAPIDWLRTQGKRVVVFLPLGGGQRELYVASAASRCVAPPSATLWLAGAAAQATYIKPLLDRVGISAEVFATGPYKTAAEPLIREHMSDAQREQLGALAQTVQDALEAALAERAGLDAASARALFERGFLMGPAARDAGLIDACRYEDELHLELAEPAGPGVATGAALKASTPVDHRRYLAQRDARLFVPLARPPVIGVVPVHGAIADAPSARAFGRRGASFAQVARALRAARRDRSIAAVILHVDSPGGSALASDLIHRELLRLRAKKPVIACLGNVAASGGYYVAVGCDHIVAQPTTTTGSIGVISARVLVADLCQRAGVRTETIRAAPHADMLSPFRALDDTERAMLQAHVQDFYGAFLNVVAQGRRRSVEEIDLLARGRVWSGRDAQVRGLIDTFGGLEQAIATAMQRASALEKRQRSDVAVRWVTARSEQPAFEPTEPSAAHEIGEALALLRADSTALYYALIPNLGS
jgi:protease-4